MGLSVAARRSSRWLTGPLSCLETWSVAANGLGTVFGALALGAVLELGSQVMTHLHRVHESLDRRVRRGVDVLAC